MKMCKEHWDMCRAAIDDRGMSTLISKDGETALANTLAELAGEPDPKNERFDPLMSMHWHWTNSALRDGGLYLMTQNEDESNEGHFCPICEYVKHSEGFNAEYAIGKVADQMLEYARNEGLVPKPA